jgi:hypothetical protein
MCQKAFCPLYLPFHCPLSLLCSEEAICQDRVADTYQDTQLRTYAVLVQICFPTCRHTSLVSSGECYGLTVYCKKLAALLMTNSRKSFLAFCVDPDGGIAIF